MAKNKYKNPIIKIQNVSISTWEYKDLVAKATILEVLEALNQRGKKYVASDVMEALFNDKEEE